MEVTKVAHEDSKSEANGELRMLFEELRALRPVK
jgi:hypothetical protein